MLTRLKKIRGHVSRRRSTIADSHALFDRIRVGPIASRQHWLKCKMHWFTSPESAKLYQAELEIKRRVGERPSLRRWWKEEDGEKSHLYRVHADAEHLSLDDSVGLKKPDLVDTDRWLMDQSKHVSAPKAYESEVEQWRKSIDQLTEEDLEAIGLKGKVFENSPLLPGPKDADEERAKMVKGLAEMVQSELEPAASPPTGETKAESGSDDDVVSNAYTIVREINEVCSDTTEDAEGCAPKPVQQNATTSV
jgi:hypothetical protein